VVLGDGAHVGRDAHVCDSVLWNEVEVMNDSVVSKSIAGQQARLGGVIRGGLCEDFGSIHQYAALRPAVPAVGPPVPVPAVSRLTA
jgi:NDP-sugar pyrophosphorylase family protein